MVGGAAIATAQWSYLHMRHVTTGSSSGAPIEAGDDYSFALEGLGPGKYEAHVYLNGEQGAPLEFELGPQGTTNLELEYAPQQQDDGTGR